MRNKKNKGWGMLIIIIGIFFAIPYHFLVMTADDVPPSPANQVRKVRSLASFTERFKKSFGSLSPSRTIRDNKDISPTASLLSKDSPVSSPEPMKRSRSNILLGPSKTSCNSPHSPHSPLAKEQKSISPEVEHTLDTMGLRKNPHQRIGRNDKTMVMYAARVGQAEQVDGLLNYDESGVDLSDAEGKTALTHAAEEGHTQVVEVLFRHRSRSIYKQDYSGSTPLMYAAGRNNFHVVRQLLTEDTQNESINIVNNKKKSALIGAAERGAVESVQVLLEYRPDITLVDEEGLDALGHACQKYEVVENKEPYGEIIALLKEYRHLHDKEGPIVIGPSLLN